MGNAELPCIMGGLELFHFIAEVKMDHETGVFGYTLAANMTPKLKYLHVFDYILFRSEFRISKLEVESYTFYILLPHLPFSQPVSVFSFHFC